MPKEQYFFCRNPKCGHYGQFIAAPETTILCPKCEQAMVRQDTGWLKIEGKMTPKDAA